MLVSSVLYVFFCMLQLLHLDVLKVDRVMHMGFAWEVTSGAGDVRGGTDLLLVQSLASPKRQALARSVCGHRVDASASPFRK